MANIGNSVNPFFYGQGNSVSGPVVQPIPPGGTPQQPISLNQTFWVETRKFYVPELFGEIDGYMVNFVPSGSNHFQKQWLITIPGNDTSIQAAQTFFNRMGLQNDNSIIDGVLISLFAGQGDNLSSPIYYAEPTNKLLSKRGEFTIEQHFFPWPNATSPFPLRNDNGIQRGSIIKFFANDGSYLISFNLPQDLHARLNTFPS
jgi:hypothetical protein